MGTSIRLTRIPSSGKEPLRRLLTDYLTEFAAKEGVESERDAAGHVPYPYFEAYWKEPERTPFGLFLGNELIGFCLLRDCGTRWQIAEFYVAPEHRCSGLGTRAVSLIKDYCRSTGRHRYLQADTQTFNQGALAFWRRQGFATQSENENEQVNVFDLQG